MQAINRDKYRLSTGREFYANNGLIGIGKDDDGDWDIVEGFDGGIGLFGSRPWTAEERAELADFMIAQWQAFKADSLAAL